MKRLLILTVGMCLLFASVPAMADQAEDEAAIRKTTKQFNAALNKNDTKAIAALLTELPIATAKEKRVPVSLYVLGKTGVEPLPKEERDALLEEMRTTVVQSESATSNMELEFTKQYGKNQDKWPDDKKAQYEAAWDAFMEAYLQCRQVSLYGGNKQKDIDDSVIDLKKRIRKKKLVRLVENSEEAELVIEVLGRGRPSIHERDYNPSLFLQVPFLKIRVSVGPRLDLPAEVGKTLKWHGAYDFVFDMYHSYNTEKPWWEFEVKYGSDNNTWTNAAWAAANAIDKFVKKKYDLLRLSRRSSPSQ